MGTFGPGGAATPESKVGAALAEVLGWHREEVVVVISDEDLRSRPASGWRRGVAWFPTYSPMY